MVYKVEHFGQIDCPGCGVSVLKQSPNQKRCKPCALRAHGQTGIGLGPRECKLCQEMIESPRAHSQKYHEDCYEIRRQQRRAERMREYRREKPEIVKQAQRNSYSNEYFSGLRERIIERDGKKCLACGCENYEKLRVHHIDELGRNVPRDQRNNDPSNLVTVCTSCHAKIHWFKMESPRPIN